jgi:hypothetical protein
VDEAASAEHLFRHIVLAIHDSTLKKWGALGLSRKENLMYKPFEYDTLSALMSDFKRSFAVWNHEVVKVTLALVVSAIRQSAAQSCRTRVCPKASTAESHAHKLALAHHWTMCACTDQSGAASHPQCL